ncbi:TerD family protein [Nocardioides houyundeii]|uniref:TerD family protein n=1 Tax=Nocardioides houyundeii TaxID=2045452 RepID=UPI000DF3511D|nr:tellurium resistance protein [Nocardioides houyundeii]
MAIDYTKKPKPAAATSPGPAGPANPVSLSKVTLTKSAPSVSLTKAGSAGGTLRVNLNWNARPPSAPAPAAGGFLKRMMSPGSSSGIDLDLGCLYEYADGSKGVVQALGNAFRDQHTFGPDPICWLDGDDRSGTNTAGENLFVNLAHVAAIKRIIVFAFIYQGVPNWGAADGVVTLFPASGPEVEVRLDETRPGNGMCGIAMLENIGGDLQVRREVSYVKGHADLDRAFGWGLRWTAGSK